jgi:hypothetical protein
MRKDMDRKLLIASGAIRVTNTFFAVEYFYRNQADADLDKNGDRPDLVLAAFCAETGREVEVPKPQRSSILENDWDVN